MGKNILPLYLQNIHWVFFLYGLGFFGVAAAILLANKQGDLELINDFDWLAAFAVLSGTAAWAVAVGVFLQASTGVEYVVLSKIHLVLLILAYLALLEFAIRLSFNRKEKLFSQFQISVSAGYFRENFSHALKVLAMVGSCAFVLALVVLNFSINDIQALVVRVIGLLASVGAAMGFMRLALTLRQYFGTERQVMYCWLMALAFLYYAVFESILYEPIYGIPIQVYRLVFSFLAAYASIRLVGILSIASGRATGPVGESKALREISESVSVTGTDSAQDKPASREKKK